MSHNKPLVNSEGFLAEVFHPWVRWEGPGSGFENSSGGAGGVWKSRIHRFGPLGIEVEKQGFRTAWLITGRKFPWKNLKSGSSLLTFRDLSSHICEIILWMAKSGILDPGKIGFFDQNIFYPKNVYDIFPGHAVPLFFRAKIFRAVPCQDFPCQDFPCRAVP